MKPPTSVTEARYQLILARKKKDRAEHNIRELKKYIESQGESVNPVDIKGRNMQIYEGSGAGKSTKELAEQFNLSTTTIRNVISRIEFDLRKSRPVDHVG